MPSENLVSHLTVIQSVIARMSDQASAMKRYAVVSTVAGFAAARITGEGSIYTLLVVLIAAFAILDARYLQQEIWFRALFDDVRMRNQDALIDFLMTPSPEHRRKGSLSKSLLSWSVIGFYGPLSIVLLIIYLSGRCNL